MLAGVVVVADPAEIDRAPDAGLLSDMHVVLSSHSVALSEPLTTPGSIEWTR